MLTKNDSKGNESAVLRRTLSVLSTTAGALSLLLVAPKPAEAQEPAACLSQNPSDWPSPAKPYFHLVVDTSGSMTACTTPPTNYPQECNQGAAGYKLNSCGFVPSRLNDAKCALRQTVQAFAGEANFGLATFASFLHSCSPGACASQCGAPTGGTCDFDYYAGCSWDVFPGATQGACGNFPTCSAGAGPGAPNWPEGTWRNGSNVLTGVLQDPWWTGGAPPASNVNEILKYFDGQCDESKELFAAGATPIAGSLRSTAQYLRAGWTRWTNANYCPPLNYTFPTPLNALDRTCRSVNVILVTDGDESCDSQAQAVAAAQDLFQNGVTLSGKKWPVRVYVINFAGGTQSATNQIASAGGTGTSLFATDEATLSVALSNVIANAIKPETCDNADNNCNGCTDEGYKHYCNTQQTCCTWSTQAQRTTCLTNYQSSITPANPQGNLALLPCTTPVQQTQPANWLCYDPKEICDGIDNNCDGQIDEGFVKCGNPPQCPTAEVCNGADDNCDGIVDNATGSGVPYSACPSGCVPSPEICDGCDNDCDGIVDNGIADIPCGSGCANCIGTRTCISKGVAVPVGTCTTPTGFGACNNNPLPEQCNGCDDNCNGTIDEGIPPTKCEIPGQPGLIYKDTFPLSQCVKGDLPCNGTCSGWVGPSAEVCDGIDNDCNGVVDDGVLPGVGADCGNGTPPCQKGKFACVGGQLVCQGGTQPQPEICDGIDNNCNGIVDDQPLTDSPANSGCWNLPATGCSPLCTHQNLSWCPPPGGDCSGKGSLASPCQTGTLQCAGLNKWTCVGGTLPAPESCDGADNDCDGIIDEDPGAPVGQTCGIDTGECQTGLWICDQGVLKCTEKGPQPEICDGKDNDCDGTIDNGVGVQGACTPTYDTNLYPGIRDKGQCKPGVTVCDPTCANPTCTKCEGGIGPSPEVCDGIDNDCDGLVDEQGAPPDGINGTANPKNPSQVIGGTCGVDVGECKTGTFACDKGEFVCAGGKGPQPEQCDCLDNDCDGLVDEDPEPGEPGICAPTKFCVVASAGNCQCAPLCGSGEFPCPTGSECKSAGKSSAPSQVSNYCISDNCGDCAAKTVKKPTGEIICAPEGTATSQTPVCVCKGNKCTNPCDGVQCPTGLACVDVGDSVGTCQPEGNCYFFGCADGKACKGGVCVDDPCEPNPCPADEVCKPNSTFTEPRCVASCASVSCPGGQKCVEGQCVGCASDCPAGQVCQLDQDGGGACVPDQCQGDAGVVCSDGSYCDPTNGTCGNHPCEAVKCPTAQSCVDGECQWAPEGGSGGSGGGGGSGGSGGGAAATDGGGGMSGSGTGGTGGGVKGEPTGVWGLATGGGGCACKAAGSRERTPAGIALLGLAVAVALTRRRRRKPGAHGSKAGRGAS
jgi:MYXO-CTERM domain-containing protein